MGDFELFRYTQFIQIACPYSSIDWFIMRVRILFEFLHSYNTSFDIHYDIQIHITIWIQIYIMSIIILFIYIVYHLLNF